MVQENMHHARSLPLVFRRRMDWKKNLANFGRQSIYKCGCIRRQTEASKPLAVKNSISPRTSRARRQYRPFSQAVSTNKLSLARRKKNPEKNQLECDEWRLTCSSLILGPAQDFRHTVCCFFRPLLSGKDRWRHLLTNHIRMKTQTNNQTCHRRRLLGVRGEQTILRKEPK